MSTLPETPTLAGADVTGWRSWLSLPRDRFCGPWSTSLLILLAWAACVLVRYQWISWAQDIDQFNWIGGLQPTTHDAFTHGTVLQQHLEGRHSENPHLWPILNRQGALHALTYVFISIVPVTIATVLVWASVLIAGLITIPIVLIGRLYGSALWGFTAAILTGIAWNYYERTMAGYFDTDIFSFTVALVAFAFLLAAHERCSLKFACFGALTVFLYPFFYAKGLVIGAGVAVSFIGLQAIYMMVSPALDRLKMIAVVAAGAAASPLSFGSRIHDAPWKWFLALGAIVVIWWMLRQTRATKRVLAIGAVCLIWVSLSMPWPYFFSQITVYSRSLWTQSESTLVEIDPLVLERREITDEINFRNTHKHTVLESQPETPTKLMQRITGSVAGTILAAIGLIPLLIRYPGFLIGMPFITIGLFAFDGGLRFTTWGGLITGMSLVYLLFILVQALFRMLPALAPRPRAVGVVGGGMLLSLPFIWVNVVHARTFKIGTVFSLDAIQAMQDLKRVSNPGDYVISWWDYGSGLWYYTDRNVLMTPISASDDCWTVASIVSNDSQKVAAGLARLAVEALADGNRPGSHEILGLNGDHPMRPAALLKGLEEGTIPIPDPTRDVFLYIPWEMVRLMSVIEAYANPEYNLPTVPEAGVCHVFSPQQITAISNKEVLLPNKVAVNLETLITRIPTADGETLPVQFKSVSLVRELEDGKTVVFKGPTPNQPLTKITCLGGGFDYRLVRPDEPIPENHQYVHLIILESTGSAMVVDDRFYNSNIVQMVAMQQFDHDLWEQVHKSGYARVFRLRRPGERSDSTDDSVDAPAAE